MTEKRSSHELEADTDPQLLNGIHYTGNKGPCFGTRYSIIIMMALGTSLSFATKTAFSVILVAMTTSNTTSNQNIPTYEWDNKGVILSSVMWLGIPIQLISGQWGRKYGHKWLIIGAVVVNAIFFMLIPPFAMFGGSIGVIFCRVIEGGANGVLSPIGTAVSGLWVPAEERSKAGMIGMGITFILALITMLASGQIVASSWGYPACCYIIGILNLLWCVGWYFLGHQSPSTHPSITPEERKYIETSLSTRKTQQNIPTPWLKLLTSVYFWAPVVAAIGVNWIDTIMSTVNLLYITKAWKIDIKQIEWYYQEKEAFPLIGCNHLQTGFELFCSRQYRSTSTTSIAPIIGMACGAFLAPLSDFLIRNNYLRVVNARRIFQTVGILGTSIVMLWMTWIPGTSMALVLANLCIGNIFTIAFSVGGAGLNILDISPTFAGVISGFASTCGQSIALFAPMTIDWFLKDESDPAEWRTIFFITAAITTSTTIFFDIFATDKRPWDIKKEDDDENN